MSIYGMTKKIQLIICEKPSAMAKVAEALADKKSKKITNRSKVSYYELEHKGKKIIVVCAVGHLYGLKQTKGLKSKYPVFDIEWAPSSEINKKAAFTKKYLDVIKKLAKEANEFVIATDKDLEGELLGYNILRFACKQKDAKRMKFSTLTKEDIIEAYKNAEKHLDKGLRSAGEARHYLDWMYGINISRALTLAVKSTGAFRILSSGRVQGPALKILYDKEKEIQAFKAKDRLIAKQACVKAACNFSSGLPTSINVVLSNAETLFNWIYEKENKTETTCPTPTAEQATALKKVLEETKWTKEQVWNKFGKYPTNQNVDICIRKINHDQ